MLTSSLPLRAVPSTPKDYMRGNYRRSSVSGLCPAGEAVSTRTIQGNFANRRSNHSIRTSNLSSNGARSVRVGNEKGEKKGLPPDNEKALHPTAARPNN